MTLKFYCQVYIKKNTKALLQMDTYTLMFNKSQDMETTPVNNNRTSKEYIVDYPV